MDMKEAAVEYLPEIAPQTREDDVPPGYKRTEVGVIPEDWNASTVGIEFSVQLGKMLDSEKNAGVSKPFLGNRAVQWGKIDVNDLSEIRLTPTDLQRYRLRVGDLLVCEGGEIGRAAIWQGELDECYYQKALHRLRTKRGYDPVLLMNVLAVQAGAGLLQNFVTQTSIAHLPKDKFEIVPVPCPPELEQRAIAAALSDADALIAALQRLIAKKRAIKQGTMQALLSGRQRLPGFTGEWASVHAGDIGSFRGGNGFPIRFQGQTSGMYPFFKVSDMSNDGNTTFMLHANNYIDERVRKSIGATAFPARSIVFAKIGAAVFLERKRILSKPSCIDNNLSGYVVDDAIADYRFIHYVLAGISFGNLANTTALPSLGGKTLAAIELELPPLDEQTAIAAVLADMDTEIEALEARLAKTRALKAGMMQQLLTGRIRLPLEDAA